MAGFTDKDKARVKMGQPICLPVCSIFRIETSPSFKISIILDSGPFIGHDIECMGQGQFIQ